MSSSQQPFFSVLIPSYNRPESITQCIDSMLKNKGEDFEIIISDDASPKAEAIANVVRPYVSRSNIRFYQQQNNIGEPANRNFLVLQATGRYNVIVGDDDTLFPHALRTIRKYIEIVPDQDLYMFGYRVINASGRKCYDRVAPKPFVISPHHSEMLRRMFEATWLPFLVCHPATFCCKRGVEAETPYRRDVFTADDYMFLLECLNKGKQMYVIPECLMTYRWAPARQSTSQVNQSADNLTVVKAYTKVYYLVQEKARCHSCISDFLTAGEYRRRFLYDLIIRRMGTTDKFLGLFGLQQQHQQELSRYAKGLRKYFIRLSIAIRVMYQLTHKFGIKGLLYAIRSAMSHLLYSASRVGLSAH